MTATTPYYCPFLLFLSSIPSDLSLPESLKDYFESLGFPVEKATIMKDKGSGRSRGFGFVVFECIDSVHEVPLIHTIEGRQVLFLALTFLFAYRLK